MQHEETWFDHQVRVKPDKIVVKRYGEHRKFLGSCVVPSVMYPLNGKAAIYTFRNTNRIDDSVLLDLIKMSGKTSDLNPGMIANTIFSRLLSKILHIVLFCSIM